MTHYFFWEMTPPLHVHTPQHPPIPYYAIFISDCCQNSPPLPLMFTTPNLPLPPSPLSQATKNTFLGYPCLLPLNNLIYKCVE